MDFFRTSSIIELTTGHNDQFNKLLTSCGNIFTYFSATFSKISGIKDVRFCVVGSRTNREEKYSNIIMINSVSKRNNFMDIQINKKVPIDCLTIKQTPSNSVILH